MISREDAIQAATQLLQASFGSDLAATQVGEIVMRMDSIREYENAWIFPFNTRTYIETRDINTALIPNIVLVPKDGAPAHYPATDEPVTKYIAEVAAGLRSWKS